ncbi:MAG: glycosyltransferase, partial [Geminocystis sp. GBBB08]|nr:glycosyltransferase [Geminocystis sp. GBBB08]
MNKPNNEYIEALSKKNNFYLNYQGLNDLDLQKKYGDLVQKIMEVNFPQWMTPKYQRKIDELRKIKIGYVSNCFRNHVVAKLAQGRFKNHDREKFEIYGYYLDSSVDNLTKEFEKYSDYFYQLSNQIDIIDVVAQKIIDDQLDILVFLDIGMYPEVTLLASLRLCPIQCTTWLHPITSGLSNIDYFLSSDLMEAKNAHQHYSETLIRLPNIGICYEKPLIPPATKTRKDFGLREDAVIYFCCQSLYKYLPQFDYIFPYIAQKISNAQFVFINRLSPSILHKFKQRLNLIFESLNFNIDNYCIFLSNLTHDDYLNLNLVSDVFLDTFSWSGGNTTLEAIACNLPVVTCPGELMRGRHSYGILKMLGVTETIASCEEEYIEIAVRLG